MITAEDARKETGKVVLKLVSVEDINNVLDKIRVEIDKAISVGEFFCCYRSVGLNDMLKGEVVKALHNYGYQVIDYGDKLYVSWKSI